MKITLISLFVLSLSFGAFANGVDQTTDDVINQVVADYNSLDLNYDPDSVYAHDKKELMEVLKDNFDVKGEIVAFPMYIEGNMSAEEQLFDDRVRVGAEAGAGFIMAGTEGAFLVRVGAYGEVLVKKTQNGGFYVKLGRYHNNPVGYSSNYASTDYGVSYENKSKNMRVGLTMREFKTNDGESIRIPMFTLGIKFGKRR